MNSVAIIGAGQLGSRHLQAIALHKEPLNIYLIDPCEQSTDTAISRFNEVDQYKNKHIFVESTVKNCPKSLFFAVISTNSRPRLQLLKQLLQQIEVKYILLEKFLFPLEHEYAEADDVIRKHGVKAFVNCARRMWPNYQEIKKQLCKDANIRLNVQGINWGLASNAIHFLDLFYYLSGENQITMDSSNLTHILTNKREGYIELAGTLTGNIESTNRFKLTSNAGEGISLEIIIESEERKYVINESKQLLTYYDDEVNLEKEFKVYYQSVLTHQVYEQLLATGQCDLATFEESATLHLKLLTAFNQFLGAKGGTIT
ncbi:hypothetical protein CD798_14820 [Bacillaceae bacterium SAOS 7]|nr:hypothetical protein CD798_14820 [Bacillaceae bacterium SAOS 7]